MPILDRDSLQVTIVCNDEIGSSVQKDNFFQNSNLSILFERQSLGMYTVSQFITAQDVKQVLNGLPPHQKTMWKKVDWALRELYPGVDESVDGQVTYRGFKFRPEGEKLLARAKQGLKSVQELAKDVRALIEKCGTGDGKGKFSGFSSDEMVNFTRRMYKVYMDWVINNTRFQAAKAVFVRLEQAITNQPFEVICDGDPVNKEGVCGMKAGEFAQVIKADARNRIYLGELFFNGMASEIGSTCGYNPIGPEATYIGKKTGVVSAEDASILTFFHELTHISAIGDTTDVNPQPYNEAKCRERARTDPDSAAKNAENYALVAKAVRVKRRFGSDISEGRGK